MQELFADICPRSVQEKTVFVGYACERHARGRGALHQQRQGLANSLWKRELRNPSRWIQITTAASANILDSSPALLCRKNTLDMCSWTSDMVDAPAECWFYASSTLSAITRARYLDLIWA